MKSKLDDLVWEGVQAGGLGVIIFLLAFGLTGISVFTLGMWAIKLEADTHIIIFRAACMVIGSGSIIWFMVAQVKKHCYRMLCELEGKKAEFLHLVGAD